jgi:hypothetical protein
MGEWKTLQRVNPQYWQWQYDPCVMVEQQWWFIYSLIKAWVSTVN